MVSQAEKTWTEFRDRLFRRYGVATIEALPVGPRHDLERAARRAGVDLTCPPFSHKRASAASATAQVCL